MRGLYCGRIACGPRHHSYPVLGEGPVDHRRFPNRGMGCRAAKNDDLQKIVGCFDLVDGRLLLPRAHNIPSDLHFLLLRFVAGHTAAPWREEPVGWARAATFWAGRRSFGTRRPRPA